MKTVRRFGDLWKSLNKSSQHFAHFLLRLQVQQKENDLRNAQERASVAEQNLAAYKTALGDSQAEVARLQQELAVTQEQLKEASKGIRISIGDK